MTAAPLAQTHLRWRDRFRHYYHQHELKLEVLMFSCGIGFDIVATREGAGDRKMILQQLVYLGVIGFILYMDVLREAQGGQAQFSPKIEKLWDYRGLALHFCLGTLMNIYSIFFLLSASVFSSIVFVLLLFGALVANELKVVRKRGADVKVALYIICVFCFTSLMFPVLFAELVDLVRHFTLPPGEKPPPPPFSEVGLVPFLCAFATTLALVVGLHSRLRKRIGPEGLKQKLLIPGLGVSGLFLLLYLVGLIPPVPISAAKMGIYHNVRADRETGEYVLSHERPWWKLWQRGDQDFIARPGDKIFFFTAISSPAHFDETVFVRWMFHSTRGWSGSDRIPMRIMSGVGRKGGYRGSTSKQNFDYGDGRWRVSVETQDGREIGRMYFTVEKADADPSRVFLEERY